MSLRWRQGPEFKPMGEAQRRALIASQPARVHSRRILPLMTANQARDYRRLRRHRYGLEESLRMIGRPDLLEVRP